MVVLGPTLLALPAAALLVWLIDPAGRVRLRPIEAAAWTAVAWAALASILVFALSLGAGHNLNAPARGQLDRTALVAIWLPLALAGAVVLIDRRRVIAELLADVRLRWRELCRLDRVIVGWIVVCALLVGLVAIVSAPTTWDSMTYHLTRVAAWLQLGGVNHYATSALPQLFQPPGAEILIAQLQALVGGDRYAAAVQTVAYLLAIGLGAQIAARLGGGRRAQLVAALLVATAPMAIMQGSSTQNDLLVAVWLLVAASQALAIAQEPRLAVVRSLVAAGAVALALLTKGTAWIYLPPILLLLAWAIVRRLGWARFAAIATAGLAIVLALNVVPWAQNQQTFGQYIFSGADAFDYSTDRHGPGDLISNLVRNGAIYLGTPSQAINEQTSSAVRDALAAAGIAPDDPATTFPGLSFAVPKAGPDESHGPSVVLFLLLLWSLALALFSASFRSGLRLTWALLIVTDIVLFALLIKWQIWHSRLHLPVVLLAVPLAAVAIEWSDDRRARGPRLAAAVTAIVCALSTVFLVFNVDRPLVGYAGHGSILTTPRERQYFAAREELADPYLKITDRLQRDGATSLAMVGGFDEWYYPFNALLGSDVRTSYILVPNASAKYPMPPPARWDAVACLNCSGEVYAHLEAAGLRRTPGLYFHIPAGPSSRSAIVELWQRAGR